MVAEEEVVKEIGLVEVEAVGSTEASKVGLGCCRDGVRVVGRWREGMGEVTGAYPL